MVAPNSASDAGAGFSAYAEPKVWAGDAGRLVRQSVLLLCVLLTQAPALCAGYAVDVQLPACEFIISKPADWKRVNDPALRVLCVAPGNYNNRNVGAIRLTQSGTPGRPRYLRWYDPAAPGDVNTHVVDIVPDRRAVIPSFRLMSDYWVIDRLVVQCSRRPTLLGNRASHNVLNRLLFEGKRTHQILRFQHSSHNTLQHSVLRNTIAVPGRDSYMIYLNDSEGERIVDNEIYNFGDGIQQSPLSRNNHVVYGNEMYLTDRMYTDCRGHRDRNGRCMCSEGMALALKGVDRPGSTFTIENNFIYGLRRYDPYCMGSGTPGVAIDLGSGANLTKGVNIKGNVLMNRVPNNIYLGLYIDDVDIADNVIGLGDRGITNVYGKNVTITGNLYVANHEDYHTGPAAKNTVYRNNREATAAELAGRCFTVRKFTDPHRVCLKDLH